MHAESLWQGSAIDPGMAIAPAGAAVATVATGAVAVGCWYVPVC